MRHADDIQAVSVDEALIEVTTSVSRCAIRPSSLAFPDDPAKSLAERIRSEVREATGCEGISRWLRPLVLTDNNSQSALVSQRTYNLPASPRVRLSLLDPFI